MTNTPTIRKFEEGDRSLCASILAGLPEWFGIAEANQAYIEILGKIPTAVALLDQDLLGFIGLERHNPKSMEIHVLATHKDHHNLGIGSALVAWSESCCRDEGILWLHVKTRGPSTPDPYYERTRGFYMANGFDVLFESQSLWGPQDAALILVKKVTA